MFQIKKSASLGGLYLAIEQLYYLPFLAVFFFAVFFLAVFFLAGIFSPPLSESTFNGSYLQDVLGKIYDESQFHASGFEDALHLGLIHVC